LSRTSVRFLPVIDLVFADVGLGPVHRGEDR
jgi:hypothetical protein